jgi:hypothetical protein
MSSGFPCIDLLNGFYFHCRCREQEVYGVVRPELSQRAWVLRQCGVNVCSVELFDGRQVRGMRAPSRKRSWSSASSEEADGEPRKKRYSHKYRSTW